MSEEKMSLSPASILVRNRSWILVRLKSLGQWSTRVSPSRATTVVSSNQVLMVVSDSSSRSLANIMDQISETDCIEALPFSVCSTSNKSGGCPAPACSGASARPPPRPYPLCPPQKRRTGGDVSGPRRKYPNQYTKKQS